MPARACDLDFLLRAGEASNVSETNTYRTAADVLDAGRPNDSVVIDLVSRRGRSKQMPPLATEVVDSAAVALLRRWIEENFLAIYIGTDAALRRSRRSQLPSGLPHVSRDLVAFRGIAGLGPACQPSTGGESLH